MEYSKENVALLVAKLRVAGERIPVYWLRNEYHSGRSSGCDSISLIAMPYTDMPEAEQRRDWKDFLEEVEHRIGKQDVSELPTNQQEK